MTRKVTAGPLFILGAPRSGTTQMHRMCQDVLHFKGGVEGCVWQSVKVLDDHFKRIMLGLGDGRDESIKGFSVVRFTREKLVSQYAESLVDLHEKEFGTRFFVDKTPGGEAISAAPLLKQLFPSAKFIFMKRRGIENVCSHLRRFAGSPFETACIKWASPMQRWLEVRDQLAPDCIEIDQRDLGVAPLDAAFRITNFLQHGDPDKVANYFMTHFPEKTQAGDYTAYVSLQNTGWDEACAQEFFDICGDMMGAYGYAMDQGDGKTPLGGSFDVVVPPRREQWKMRSGNQWIDTRGPGGLRLHPNEPGKPDAVLVLGGCLEPGHYKFEAEILVFDAQCRPHQVIMAAVGRSTSQEWGVEIDGTKMGKLGWRVPLLEIAEPSDLQIRVILGPAALNSMYSATQLVSAVFTRVAQSAYAVSTPNE